MLGVSRPIYVNIDSPKLGFPYFNFLGGYQWEKKHPVPPICHISPQTYFVGLFFLHIKFGKSRQKENLWQNRVNRKQLDFVTKHNTSQSGQWFDIGQ